MNVKHRVTLIKLVKKLKTFDDITTFCHRVQVRIGMGND